MYCRTCGALMDENQDKCFNCGTEAGKGDLFCSNCGEIVPAGAEVCTKCGFSFNKPSVNPGVSFCSNCGTPVSEGAAFCLNCGNPVNGAANNGFGAPMGGRCAGIQKRDLVKAIILTIVTCGIYGLIWFINLTNDMNKASGRTSDTSGGTAFILSLVTCGIYMYYWAYKMGEKRDIVANEKSSASVLYLVLMFLGFGIVVYCLSQDAINKAIDANR